MLRSMTWQQFLEWRAFDEVEPFGDERADFRTAHVVQTLVNLARDPKRYPSGWPIEDFVLRFGDSPWGRAGSQTIAQQEAMIDAWIAGSNAVFAEQEARKGGN